MTREEGNVEFPLWFRLQQEMKGERDPERKVHLVLMATAEYVAHVQFVRPIHMYFSTLGLFRKNLQEALEKLKSPIEEKDIVKTIFDRIVERKHTIEPPTEAPEKYADRVNRDENAAQFIIRVYSKWLGKGLTKADLKHLDEQLYRGYFKWKRANKLPLALEFGLENAQGRQDWARQRGGGRRRKEGSTWIPNEELTPEAAEKRRKTDRERMRRFRERQRQQRTLDT